MSSRRVRLVHLALALGLVAVTCVATEDTWWTDAVFYEVFVRSFHDSDGDGIGDLQGLIEKLDDLNDGDPTTTGDLGVTALWLMPIFESPSYHGYDTTDYYAIDRDYGSLDDFRELLDAAHERGIQVIIDLALNHTSNEHPWFQSSMSGDPDYADWYIWSSGFPSYQGPWGQQVWHLTGRGLYCGLFWRGMPDLNYRNPEVSIAMLNVAGFWLDEIGVDGFRLDAVRHLIEDGEQQENTPATHDWLKIFRLVAKDMSQVALLLGEVWDAPEAILPYLDKELDLCFEFSLAEAILGGVQSEDAGAIRSALDHVLDLYPPGSYATFLTNHDQERTATRLGEDDAKMKAAASILLTLPGTPFLYYGEEIGLTGVKPDEQIRTPMQWSIAPNAGFTDGIPWEPLAAPTVGGPVDAQRADPGSLWSRYRSLIQLRSGHAALRSGTTAVVDAGDPAILSYLREGDHEVLWVLHNISTAPTRATRLLPESGLLASGVYAAIDLLGDTADLTIRLASNGDLTGMPSLGSFATRVLELGKP